MTISATTLRGTWERSTRPADTTALGLAALSSVAQAWPRSAAGTVAYATTASPEAAETETPSDDFERSASCGLPVNEASTQPISETAMPMPETNTRSPAALLARWASPASTLLGRPLRSGRTTMSVATPKNTRNLLRRRRGQTDLTG